MKRNFTTEENAHISDACFKIFSVSVYDDPGNDSKFLIPELISSFRWKELFSTDTWNRYLRNSENNFDISYVKESFIVLEHKFPKEIKKIKKLMKKEIFPKSKKIKKYKKEKILEEV